MKAIEKIKAKYRSLEPKIVHVPEWDLDIYVLPLTVGEADKLQKLTKEADNVISAVDVLILKGLDKDLEPMFEEADVDELINNTDMNVLIRVVNEISTAVMSNVEVLKNE